MKGLGRVAECIHGFDDRMCDICFPQAPREPVAAAATKGSTRAARSAPPRTPAPRRSPSGPAGTPAKAPPFATRRLYHVTPLANLESILLDGTLRATADGFAPDVDLAAPLVRELRAHADVGDGRRVHEFVPFSISPDAERWVELRTGATDPHWSAAARSLAATDYAVLVTVARDLGADLVIADGDAAAPRTRFTIGDVAKVVAQALRIDPELASLEVLVPGPVQIGVVNLIAVANEPARARVRNMLSDLEGSPPRVVVHPPWFAQG